MHELTDSGDDKVVIVGAGLCGLSAAFGFISRGIKPVIIEKSNHIGGLADSIEFEGRYFDIGVHMMPPKSDSDIEHLIQRLDIKWLRSRNDSAINLPAGKISRAPELRNFLRYPGKLKLDLLKTKLLGRDRHDTLESHLRSIFGNWLYDSFFSSYIAKKIPGYKGESIHGDWWGMSNKRDMLNRFVDNPGEKTAGRFTSSILRRMRWGIGFLFGHNGMLIYPPEGIGQIARRMGNSLENEGIRILYNSEIKELCRENGGISGIRLSDGTYIPCKYLIWTGFLPDLARLTDSDWPEDLRYISTAIVLLVFKRNRRINRRFLFEYVAATDCLFQRFYFDDYYSAEDDKFGICCEISYWNRSDLPEEDIIIDDAVRNLKKYGAIRDEHMLAAKVVFVPNTHPVYSLNYRESLAKVFSGIYKINGLYPAGRSGAFNNLGMRGSALAGWKSAEYCSDKFKIRLNKNK